MYYRRYKKGRHWGVYTAEGELICLCVFKKGAANVVRLLQAREETAERKGG